MPSRRALRLPALLLAGGAALSGCAGTGTAEAPDTQLDWKALAYEAADCASRAEWVADGLPAEVWDERTVSTTRADVTGDGSAEVLVVTACPSAASEPAEGVVVLDLSRGAPATLGVLGDGVRFQGATVAVDGRSLSVSGLAPTDDDPTCCPGSWTTLTYGWTGSEFALTERLAVRTTRPVVAADLPDGRYVGFLRAVTPDTVYLDRVDWFEGPAAAAACAEDGVQDNGWEQCGAYYVRDVDDEVGALPVRPGASASYVDAWTAESVVVPSVGALAGTDAVSDDDGEHAYVRVTVSGGEVTAVEGVYVP